MLHTGALWILPYTLFSFTPHNTPLKVATCLSGWLSHTVASEDPYTSSNNYLNLHLLLELPCAKIALLGDGTRIVLFIQGDKLYFRRRTPIVSETDDNLLLFSLAPQLSRALFTLSSILAARQLTVKQWLEENSPKSLTLPGHDMNMHNRRNKQQSIFKSVQKMQHLFKLWLTAQTSEIIRC